MRGAPVTPVVTLERALHMRGGNQESFPISGLVKNVKITKEENTMEKLVQVGLG